ncbi:MAG: protease modulator HflC [Chthoniobacter sp.]|uniref:protease modulator HflC n=1 Tax=Chthoniobacter sp. TaxID=2510640 RepID=UPI0032AD0AD8
MNTKAFSILLFVIAVLALLAVSGAFYTVSEMEQVIITQFGKPIGEPITEAGLHFKTPFIQDVHSIEKRVLEWDGPVAEMPTKDKLYIVVDTFARWRISNPAQYYIRLSDQRSAQSRLDDILGSETRNTVARHELVEMIRTTKDRKAAVDDTLVAGSGAVAAGLPSIQFGRVALEKEITDEARGKLAEFGIELLDVRFKRINYNPAVSSKIYDRMTSERRQIAARFRSEGEGEAAKIIGAKDRDLKEIESKAYREVQTVEGKADAEATAIYAKAFNSSQEARDLYQFQRTLDTYKTSFQGETTLILSTQSSFLRFLKGASPTSTTTPPKTVP